ncbi:MAG: CAP domain-containing protein [Salinibacter sp.]
MYRPINEYVLEQTNAERQRGRLSPLRHDPTLSQIACGHNRDMLKHDYMGHQDSDGHSPSDRVRWQHRRLLGEVSENTYRGDSLSGPDSHEDNQRWATRIVERWMQSAPHRKNILGTNWTHVGACVMRDAATGRATQVLANVHA